MDPYAPFHEYNWKAFDTALPDWQISHWFFLIDAYWIMSSVNTGNFRTCDKLETTCPSCNRLAHWVWLQVLYAILAACKQLVFQLRTFLEESCVYQCKYLYIHTYIYMYIYTFNKFSLCSVVSYSQWKKNSTEFLSGCKSIIHLAQIWYNRCSEYAYSFNILRRLSQIWFRF